MMMLSIEVSGFLSGFFMRGGGGGGGGAKGPSEYFRGGGGFTYDSIFNG